MAVFHKASDLANHQRKKAERMAHTAQVQHAKMANDLYLESQKLVSGKVSTSQQRRMGHPYGRKSGSYSDLKTKKRILARQRTVKGTKTRLPTLPINQQTGKLKSSIKLTRQGAQGNTKQTYILQALRNIAPYAKWILSLGGTTKMIGRPFWQTLKKSWKKKNFDLLIKLREEQRKD